MQRTILAAALLTSLTLAACGSTRHDVAAHAVGAPNAPIHTHTPPPAPAITPAHPITTAPMLPIARESQATLLASAPLAPATLESAGSGITISTRVEAYATKSYTITFERGQRVEIYAQGDGDTDVDLFVYDPAGRLIDSDEGITDEMSAQFRASRAGHYRVVLRNLGNVWNQVELSIP